MTLKFYQIKTQICHFNQHLKKFRSDLTQLLGYNKLLESEGIYSSLLSIA